MRAGLSAGHLGRRLQRHAIRRSPAAAAEAVRSRWQQRGDRPVAAQSCCSERLGDESMPVREILLEPDAGTSGDDGAASRQMTAVNTHATRDRRGAAPGRRAGALARPSSPRPGRHVVELDGRTITSFVAGGVRLIEGILGRATGSCCRRGYGCFLRRRAGGGLRRCRLQNHGLAQKCEREAPIGVAVLGAVPMQDAIVWLRLEQVRPMRSGVLPGSR